MSKRNVLVIITYSKAEKLALLTARKQQEKVNIRNESREQSDGKVYGKRVKGMKDNGVKNNENSFCKCKNCQKLKKEKALAK